MLLADVRVFEKKLNELRARRLESIDVIYHTSHSAKDLAEMYYEAGLNEARAAIYMAIIYMASKENNNAE